MTQENSKINQFKKELKELLTKYNATIDCDLQGDDLHGVSAEMLIYVDGKYYPVNKYDQSIHPSDL